MKSNQTTPHAARDAGRFSLDINLDDEHEARAFTLAHGACPASGRAIAHSLGLHGKGADSLARNLLCYAWNKVTAVSCRKRGDIQAALKYEAICDTIYTRDINPKLEAW